MLIVQVQEAYTTLSGLDQKRKSKHVETRKNTKRCKGKGQLTHKVRPIRIMPDFSMETLMSS